MKYCFLFVALAFLGFSNSADAQTRMLINNTPCNHVFIIEWVDGACNHIYDMQYGLGPFATLTITGPGGAGSPFFQINHALVDNVPGGIATVSNPACPGPPPMIMFAAGMCAMGVNINPGADVTVY